LLFDSHFESGNCHSCFRIYPPTLQFVDTQQIYDLYLHNDVHTSGHTQWFYFSVSNTKIGVSYTFNLRNFAKPDSMFHRGMRPLLYSTLSKEKIWVRCGTNITYFGPLANNNIVEDAKKKRKKGQPAPGMYTLSFTVSFEKPNDTCYFAFCHPYTYTDLQRYLYGIQRNKSTFGPKIKRETLCRTLAGNLCDLLTITAPASSIEEVRSRVLCVVTGRVHPGETNASWMMHGILDYLISNTKEAEKLRNMYVFKIVPILNPDGVINGNYRTSLSGNDLNRRWYRPEVSVHPTIHHAKNMIRETKKLHPQCIVMDLHGHSTKEGIFIYGCVPDKKHLRPPSPRRVSSEQDLDMSNNIKTKRVQSPAPSSTPIPDLSINGNKYGAPDHEGVMTPLVSATAVAVSALAAGAAKLFQSKNKQCSNSTGNTSYESQIDTNNIRSQSPKPSKIASNLPSTNDITSNRPITATSCSTAMKRDLLEWRVKLFPRVLSTFSDIFVLEHCSFKVHRSKASTMRIVNFIELGIDCVYTIEASLAGYQGQHFTAHDLHSFGKDVCLSLGEIYPALSSFSISSEQDVHNWNPLVTCCQDTSEDGLTLQQEINRWKECSAYDTSALGVSLMTEASVKEITTAAIDGEGRDDDDSDIDEPSTKSDKKGDKSDDKEDDTKKKKKDSKLKKKTITTGDDKEKDNKKSSNVLTRANKLSSVLGADYAMLDDVGPIMNNLQSGNVKPPKVPVKSGKDKEKNSKSTKTKEKDKDKNDPASDTSSKDKKKKGKNATSNRKASKVDSSDIAKLSTKLQTVMRNEAVASANVSNTLKNMGDPNLQWVSFTDGSDSNSSSNPSGKSPNKKKSRMKQRNSITTVTKDDAIPSSFISSSSSAYVPTQPRSRVLSAGSNLNRKLEVSIATIDEFGINPTSSPNIQTRKDTNNNHNSNINSNDNNSDCNSNNNSTTRNVNKNVNSHKEERIDQGVVVGVMGRNGSPHAKYSSKHDEPYLTALNLNRVNSHSSLNTSHSSKSISSTTDVNKNRVKTIEDSAAAFIQNGPQIHQIITAEQSQASSRTANPSSSSSSSSYISQNSSSLFASAGARSLNVGSELNIYSNNHLNPSNHDLNLPILGDKIGENRRILSEHIASNIPMTSKYGLATAMMLEGVGDFGGINGVSGGGLPPKAPHPPSGHPTQRRFPHDNTSSSSSTSTSTRDAMKSHPFNPQAIHKMVHNVKNKDNEIKAVIGESI